KALYTPFVTSHPARVTCLQCIAKIARSPGKRLNRAFEGGNFVNIGFRHTANGGERGRLGVAPASLRALGGCIGDFLAYVQWRRLMRLQHETALKITPRQTCHRLG